MAMANLAAHIGNAVKTAVKNNGSGGWHGRQMAAASRAIRERIPLVDLVLEVRDARIPLSSQYGKLLDHSSPSKRIIVMNKIDLANQSEIKKWFRYLELQNCISHGVNSHNKESIKEFLNFLQAQVRKLKKNDHSSNTITIMLVGIPNVGKSALANSLHKIGRITAAEKGKLKHSIVSPTPGETKEISSLKIGSHPNIYVLDTPGVLPPQILDFDVCSKLALTGAISDCLAGEKELAEYFLSILNSSDEYKKWAKLSINANDTSTVYHKEESLGNPKWDMKLKRQYPTDHTQDFIVNNVRRAIYEAILSFDGKLENERDLIKLIDAQFAALHKAFHVPVEQGEDAQNKVAAKLVNLYRIGRLGHYTMDPAPTNNLPF